MKTKTILRKFKAGGDLIAIFPEDRFSGECCSSHQHIGQHGAFSAEAIGFTAPATREECEPLLRELKDIGYDVEVVGDNFQGNFVLSQWIRTGQVGRDLPKSTATLTEIKAALSAAHDVLLTDRRYQEGRARKMAEDVLDRFPGE